MYAAWLRRFDPFVAFVELEQEDGPLESLRRCDGLLLPGGADVDPVHFGKEMERPVCTIDSARDTLEFQCIQEAFDQRLPVLGICRGLQIINVFLGGSLITDLPIAGYAGHGKTMDGDSNHAVRVTTGSRLGQILGESEGIVNSAHHQAVDRIAPDLQMVASSEDGVVEGLEWKDPSKPGYLLLVQWHPERMSEEDSPFARGIAEDFLRALKERR